jgi:hypothetical protein
MATQGAARTRPQFSYVGPPPFYRKSGPLRKIESWSGRRAPCGFMLRTATLTFLRHNRYLGAIGRVTRVTKIPDALDPLAAPFNSAK